MSTRLDIDPRSLGHAVHVYGTDSELADLVASYLTAGSENGSPVVVIATPEHLDSFMRAARARGVDPCGRDGWLKMDAADTLARFMVDGRPDPVAFDTTIGGVVRALRDSGGQPVAYGEMVALLWAEGQVAAALELETLWNQLAEREEFSLLCAYSASAIGSTTADAYAAICKAHSEVLGSPTPPLAARRSFPCSTTSPRDARQFVGEALQRWGLDSLSDDAAVVLTELAANAVLHARTDFVVELSLSDQTLEISVKDGSPQLPAARPSQSSVAPDGRGLNLVAGLARAWGCSIRDDGKRVWARVTAELPGATWQPEAV